jgi:hypothetical protein
MARCKAISGNCRKSIETIHNDKRMLATIVPDRYNARNAAPAGTRAASAVATGKAKTINVEAPSRRLPAEEKTFSCETV